MKSRLAAWVVLAGVLAGCAAVDDEAAGPNEEIESNQAGVTNTSALISIDGNQFPTKTTGCAAGTAWNLYTNGYVETGAVIFPSSGSYQFQVRAHGAIAANEWPLMDLRIDGKTVQTTRVASTTVATYASTQVLGAGSHKIEVAFTNDYYASGQDRNLYVDHLLVSPASGSVTTSGSSTSSPTPPPTCALSSRAVVPAIATQAAWDAKFDAQYGTSLPTLSGNADTFAWQGHYWVRAYVSMAKTYGDTKYLDRAATTIDYWFAHTEGDKGWGASLGPAQQFLDTGVIAQAVGIFAHAVWNDARFTAYRAKATAYVASLESIVHTYDNQWVEGAPYPGSPGFYIYATCNGLCSPASLVMYNQGAAMAKTLLLIDRVKRLQGQTPDPGYLHKASASAAYFKTFVRSNGSAYSWDYGGARPNTGIEDTSHAHLDLSLVVPAQRLGLGGLTATDMTYLAGTMHKVLDGAAGPSDVSTNVDGTGTPSSNYDRVSVGYDWIELADVDPTLFDKTVAVFNKYMAAPSSARFYLGWAEILRKRSCVSL